MEPRSPNRTRFDHETLDVYRLELEFLAWVTLLLRKIRKVAPGLHREGCDQLDRASLSALLNTAEGNGKRQTRQRARFFDDARGSAVECAACLDAMVAKALCRPEEVEDGKRMLLRVVSMLSKLVGRFERSGEGLRDEEMSDQVCLEAGDAAIDDEGRERGGGR